MRISSTVLFSLILSLGISIPVMAAEGDGATGQSLAFDRNKGNCLACHAIPNDAKATSPGDIGPALIGMKARFPDRAKLRAQIWDATVNNQRTSMPPFGRNKILTEAELDQVTDYIYGL
ncbi:MAG: sulfur oxidation c-type cytochrome SoxX [Gallionellales bacterium 35-53-114]|nr:MAG: sulfur oxidation c-type cytochrome SoxX [Gallionellales bacterium 35-53-114]OYZ64153.1 MAG: sulfur oxidation c-type cytochrome SoxX [Gallionellales bacterium 24-53-125]OZB10686.1 MAG: sulfur oxidation c-type cytochrome SoxX [Gallionellales bacterium 39-52-133]HQS57158.1 sulfur oxidation c-type cytochrome SoxX [Gallionellaceae bacterium]HQS74654.1 sulfur oxidation c-type cytochrome SoxX [Gallionellaceae bacterium]